VFEGVLVKIDLLKRCVFLILLNLFYGLSGVLFIIRVVSFCRMLFHLFDYLLFLFNTLFIFGILLS
jgi:hypothetical protein